MYINPNTSEHIYSSYEVGKLINKTPAQISRLINKGYLQGTLTKSGYVFSDQQLNGLEKRFESQKYLSTPERVELANNLGLSETQVSLVVVNIFFLSISFFT
jgi:hypothetical protein